MSKQTFISGIWMTVSSPATLYPMTWNCPKFSRANFWTKNDFSGSDFSAMRGSVWVPDAGASLQMTSDWIVEKWRTLNTSPFFYNPLRHDYLSFQHIVGMMSMGTQKR